ncbi:MAG TPA: S41 family peptidase [Planctomycetaceae bacterium]|nr:S41 family peptidase [Planctomycetaceae bacterium]
MCHQPIGTMIASQTHLERNAARLLYAMPRLVVYFAALVALGLPELGRCDDRAAPKVGVVVVELPPTRRPYRDPDEFPGNPYDEDFSPSLRGGSHRTRDRGIDASSEGERIRRRLTSRYQTPAIVHVLQTLSPEQSLALYAEISNLIDARHLHPSAYAVRVDHAARSLREAVRNPAFLEASGISRSATLDDINSELGELARARVSDGSEAYRSARHLMQVAERDSPTAATAIALEFVFGALDSLDRYSAFAPSTKQGDPLVELEGHVVGIGVEIEAVEEGMRINRVLANSPAAESGLMTGDVIESIDGHEMSGALLEYAVSLIAGPEGSRLSLRVRRGDRAAEFAIGRRRVEVHSISTATLLDQGVGYIKLERFAETTPRELEQALLDLNRRGMRSLILDLRGNPGGFLTMVVETASQFIPCGAIVSTRGRDSSDDTVEYAHGAGWASGLPLAVLVDRHSASASEIFAAAIQDSRRGLIVGETTYGKGSVQTHFPLQSVAGDLVLTTAHFLSPKGRPIDGEGVEPDVPVPLGSLDVNFRRSQFRPIPGDGGPEWDRGVAAAFEAAKSEEAYNLAHAPPNCGLSRAPSCANGACYGTERGTEFLQ